MNPNPYRPPMESSTSTIGPARSPLVRSGFVLLMVWLLCSGVGAFCKWYRPDAATPVGSCLFAMACSFTLGWMVGVIDAVPREDEPVDAETIN